jgi:hypothetical protein
MGISGDNFFSAPTYMFFLGYANIQSTSKRFFIGQKNFSWKTQKPRFFAVRWIAFDPWQSESDPPFLPGWRMCVNQSFAH